MKVLRYPAVALLFVFLTSCRTSITGSGNIVETSVEVPNFQNLTIEGDLDAEIIADNAFKVKIIGDDNLVEFVETNVKEGTLKIKFRDKINVRDSHVKVIVTAPFLNRIVSAGSGDITSDNLMVNNSQVELKSAGSGNMHLNINAPAIKVSGSGSGNFTLTGSTKDLEYSMAGSGDIDSRELKAENARIKVAGSGNVRVFANGSLSASIAGSGDIFYYGNPSLSEVKVAGSGTIKSGE